MQQNRVMQLLREAASIASRKPDRYISKLAGIQCTLVDAVYLHRDREAALVAKTVLESVFVDTIENRPKHLPELFPFLAALCGDRDQGAWITRADWDILSPKPLSG